MNRTSDGTGRQGPSLLESALQYHRRGWTIIPIGAGTKRPPRGCKWKGFQARRPGEEQLGTWFGRPNVGGIAVILGAASGGLVCRDFDVAESYHRWKELHPELAATLPTAATGRGFHVYFRSTYQGFVDLGDGELRGDAGHYCVLPPSRHPDGRTYRWEIGLPAGTLPLVEDLRGAGFLPVKSDDTESTESTESTETTEDYRGIPNAVVASDVQAADVEADLHSAILAALPAGPGRRNKQVFELARLLKAIPRLADAPVDALQPHVRCWHETGVARGLIATEPFEESWIDFLRAWPKVKFPKGTEPMKAIVERAQQSPVPCAAEKYEQPQLRLLVAVCHELQVTSGDRPFFLSCRTAGRLLDVPHVTAARWLFLLGHDGVIREVEKGDQKTRRASRYVYLAR